MGATRDDFIKYPRTPHLFGSKGTDDDKHLGQKESEPFIVDPSLIGSRRLTARTSAFISHRTDAWCCNAVGTKSPKGCTRNTIYSSNGPR